MRLTTKGRYAVTAMLDLALHAEQGPVSLADIAARQTISLSYLEQLFARLRKQKLVQSIRGPGGGYLLFRAPEQISVAHIIDAVDESVDATQCRKMGNCARGEQCLTHDLWAELTDHIHQFLSNITLARLVADARCPGNGRNSLRGLEPVPILRQG
ncbi:MAG: Fe-S cluster assembly transcriptional regulator IscR [Hahellaceae bacterium]|nr:Fe-S cluster assembly transcriptional regulator IscR [Hahellaceae bacterium]